MIYRVQLKNIDEMGNVDVVDFDNFNEAKGYVDSYLIQYNAYIKGKGLTWVFHQDKAVINVDELFPIFAVIKTLK